MAGGKCVTTGLSKGAPRHGGRQRLPPAWAFQCRRTARVCGMRAQTKRVRARAGGPAATEPGSGVNGVAHDRRYDLCSGDEAAGGRQSACPGLRPPTTAEEGRIPFSMNNNTNYYRYQYRAIFFFTQKAYTAEGYRFSQREKHPPPRAFCRLRKKQSPSRQSLCLMLMRKEQRKAGQTILALHRAVPMVQLHYAAHDGKPQTATGG